MQGRDDGQREHRPDSDLFITITQNRPPPRELGREAALHNWGAEKIGSWNLSIDPAPIEIHILRTAKAG